MGFADIPADTEAQQILSELRAVQSRLDSFADALNGLGANQQWLVDNVKGVFEMFGSPAFMSQMMGVMANGPFGPAGPAAAEPPGDGPASTGP